MESKKRKMRIMMKLTSIDGVAGEDDMRLNVSLLYKCCYQAVS
jgi:hypothetical protein